MGTQSNNAVIRRLPRRALIIGYGVVGRQTLSILVRNGYEVDIKDPALGYEPKHDSYAVAVICINVIHEFGLDLLLKNIQAEEVIIRSTIWPELLDSLMQIRPVSLWPEFLKESDPAGSTTGLPHVMSMSAFGLELSEMETVKFLGTMECCLLKLYQNSYFAMRVTHSNMFHRLCQKLGADYKLMVGASHMLTDITGDISRTGSLVPGPDGMHGYGGKCLPKDLGFTLDTFAHCELAQETVLLAAIRTLNEEYRE